MRKLCMLFCIISLIACEENEVDTENPDEKEIRAEYLLIGDSSNMKVDTLNLSTYGSRYNVVISCLDIDKDGVNDFNLYHFAGDKWDASFVSLKCLNEDSYVKVQYMLDTTYHQFLYDTAEPGGFPVFMEIFNCEKDNPHGSTQFDSIYEIKDRAYIQALDTGDSITVEDTWISDSLLLSLSDRFYWYCENHAIEEKLGCDLFPDESEKFIGIKQGERLGWIKLSIQLSRDTYIYETGLQE